MHELHSVDLEVFKLTDILILEPDYANIEKETGLMLCHSLFLYTPFYTNKYIQIYKKVFTQINSNFIINTVINKAFSKRKGDLYETNAKRFFLGKFIIKHAN